MTDRGSYAAGTPLRAATAVTISRHPERGERVRSAYLALAVVPHILRVRRPGSSPSVRGGRTGRFMDVGVRWWALTVVLAVTAACSDSGKSAPAPTASSLASTTSVPASSVATAPLASSSSVAPTVTAPTVTGPLSGGKG